MIYRAPMRARVLDVPPGVGAEFGVEHGVVGVAEDGRIRRERRAYRTCVAQRNAA